MVTDEGFPKTKAPLGAQPCNVAFLVAEPTKDVDPHDRNKDKFKKLENGSDLSDVISFSKDGRGGRDED